MEDWWTTFVLFGVVIPAGIMGTLVLRDRLACARDGRGTETRHAGTASRHRQIRRWTS